MLIKSQQNGYFSYLCVKSQDTTIMDFILRPATLQDAPFIAKVMIEAIHRDTLLPDGTLKNEYQDLFLRVMPIVQRADTLYSWKHTTVAKTADGTPIAGIIAYEGKNYAELRQTTFALLADVLDFDPTKMDDEARPGELYIDSLATLPPYRGTGIGRTLLQYWIERATELELTTTLAVSPENPRALALYQRLGFRDAGPLFIFGENYRRFSFSTSN